MRSRRVTRPDCLNCTCSPGLLSRSKRSSVIAKRIGLKRSGSGSNSPSGSRKASVFTIDAASLCLPEVKEINTSMRLEALRTAMAVHDVGVYIVPSEDQHQSEYVAPLDQRRSFISGFSGSAGTCIVTRDVASLNESPEGLAALATDGRYFKQALEELDFNWTLLKQGTKNSPTWEEWAVAQAVQMSLDSGKTVNIGVDPKLVLCATHTAVVAQIKAALAKNPGARVGLVALKENLVDLIWTQFEDRPEPVDAPIKILAEKYTGQSVLEKLLQAWDFLQTNGAQGMIVSALDEIAWLLNLRGADIQYNPVFYSYMIISRGSAVLYVDELKFEDGVREYLEGFGVQIKPYEQFWVDMVKTSGEYNLNNQTFVVDANTASWEIVRLMKCGFELVVPSPIGNLKAIKNETELRGAHKAHLKDGRALVKFFAWLENKLVVQSEFVDEIQADEQLTKFRKEEANFVGLSFDTISATGANGAVIHYKPAKGTCRTIDPEKIYLNDSGSQFLEGTTDTTRTMHFGTPKKDQIRNYTLVLKGNVTLGKLRFPEGTTGSQIDSLARQFLWQHGLDYGHGTAHGVGAFLNVHEGPIGIGPRPSARNPLKVGNLISNEPGYYEEGEYGIRIENVMYVKDLGLIYNDKQFLEFETVTRVPFCRKLIDVSMLTEEEKKWINKFHAKVWEELSPLLEKNSLEFLWLRRETSAL